MTRSSTRHEITHRVIAVAMIALLAALTAGCYETSAEPILFDNQSDQRILIYLDSNDDQAWNFVDAGSKTTDESICVDPDLIARLDNGSEVARRDGPFCEGDPPWVFTQPEVDSAIGP